MYMYIIYRDQNHSAGREPPGLSGERAGRPFSLSLALSLSNTSGYDRMFGRILAGETCPCNFHPSG